jgi:protein-S-isoprenylcysteine O-methyltransferase Ste14
VKFGTTRTVCRGPTTYSVRVLLSHVCPRMSHRAIIVVPFVVLTVVGVFFALAYLVTIWFRIPEQFGFSLPVRFIGLLLLLSGFVFLGWLFRYRRPVDILISTYVTFSKAGSGRMHLEERASRTEPLVVKGPYKYVRHPLYSDVVLLLLGWWLLLDYSFLLISALLLLLWFSLVVTRFEERELRVMFGDDYEKYVSQVPRIIPFTGKLGKLLARLGSDLKSRYGKSSA